MTEDASTTTPSLARRLVYRRRGLLVGTALALAAVDLAAKKVAEQKLDGGQDVGLGLIDLRLAYNSGAAFSLGAGLPSWIIIVMVSLITAGVAVFAWREVPRAPLLLRIGLSGVLAGAVANLLDRATDGVVTDYLHTGWWPTFNLADVFITLGAISVMLAALQPARPVNGDATTTPV